MIDEICHKCLFDKPDKRCDNFVKMMVDGCKGLDIKIIKMGDKKYKVSDDTFYPVEAPDVLVNDLEHMARAKDRVCIYFNDSQQKFDQNEGYYFKVLGTTEVNAPKVKEIKWTGYVKRTQGAIKKPTLFTYRSSKNNREIPVLRITHMEWCRKKQGREKKIYPPDRPIF